MKNNILIFIKTIVLTIFSYAVFDAITIAGWKYLASSKVPDNSLLYIYFPLLFIAIGAAYINKKHPRAFWFIVVGCISLSAILEVTIFFTPAPK